MVTLMFVGLILLFFVVDLLVVRRIERPPKEHGHGEEAERFPLKSEILMPPDYHFHPGHTWAIETDGGRIAVGVDDLVQAAVGRLTAVDLPDKGETLAAGDRAITLRVGGRELCLVAPFAGTVETINTDLKSNPSLVNTDPYGSGWLLELKPAGGKGALEELVTGDAAAEWMRGEISRAGEFVARYRKASSVTHMLIGGNKQVWTMFEDAFLRGARGEA